MTNSCIYIYRNYVDDDDDLMPEYLNVKECCGTILWRWCTYGHDATAFDNLNEARKYIEKYTKEFGGTEYSFAFMEPVTVMKNYYSHEILEEV